MADFKLPELGENVSGGDVLRLLVKPGDTVKEEQPVLELETDKATIEVPSSVAGTVTEIKVKQGDKVKVGQTILTLEDTKETKETKDTKEQPNVPVEAAAEGGLSQRAAPPETSTDNREEARSEAREDRESGTPGTVDRQPGRPAIPRQPEDEFEETPRSSRRGEVVDIS